MMTSYLMNTRSHNEESTSQSTKLRSGQENMPGKQLHQGSLPFKTPRKALGSLKNNSQTYSARKPSVGSVQGSRRSTLKTPREKPTLSKALLSTPSVVQEVEFDTEPEFIPEPSKEKQDVYRPPSFLHALRTFRPVPSQLCNQVAAKSSMPSGEIQVPLCEPRRPGSRQDDWASMDVHPYVGSTAPNEEVDLPDIADLDELLANLI